MEENTGFASSAGEGRKVPGVGHAFLDVTEEPASAITQRHGLNYFTEAGTVREPDRSKPPYRLPSMADVAAARGTNGRTVVSTFSGCGGSCLGFELAGFEVLWASEFVDAAADVYEANHPGVPVDRRDIRTVTAGDVLAAAGLAVGELDVLEGSPPCSAFSTAGTRADGWGKAKPYSDTTQDSVEDLFYEWVRLLDGIRPKAFVAENVAGLAKGVAKGYLKDIVRRMRETGYRVRVGDLDAQWLGVPQRRRRLIFQGVRDDVAAEPRFPKPLPYRYSVAEACPWIVSYRYDSAGYFGPQDTTVETPANTVTTGGLVSNAYHHKVEGPEWEDGAPEADAWMGGYATGREAAKLGPGEQSERYFSLVRAPVDGPSDTVTAIGGQPGVASVMHPTELRKFSIRELRRICGFPDDFVLLGSYRQQWERLGRAVPPPMMAAVAREVAALLDDAGA